MSTTIAAIALVASLSGAHQLPLTSVSSAASQQNVARHAATAQMQDRTADVNAMLAALNARRTAKGLAPLALDPALCTVAFNHASDMVSRDYFDHVSPEGVNPFQRMDAAHIAYGYAGENLALDQNTNSAEKALYQSPEHRDNILGSHYAKVGIAAVNGADGEIFVEDFSD